jgi:excisionase family DNA binding protein
MKELAAILKMQEQTLRLWARQGKIEVFKVGSEYRMTKKAFQKLFDPGIPSTMNEEEAADYLGVTLAEIKELCDKRLMPFSFKNNTVLFSKDDIDEWLKSFVKQLL